MASRSAWFTAAAQGDVEAIAALSQRAAGSRDPRESSPAVSELNEAIAAGRPPCWPWGARAGADALCSSEASALSYACWAGQHVTAEALSRLPLEPYSRDRDGRTALMWACISRASPRCLACARLLAGREAGIVDRFGMTALMYLAANAYLQQFDGYAQLSAELATRERGALGVGDRTALMQAVRVACLVDCPVRQKAWVVWDALRILASLEGGIRTVRGTMALSSWLEASVPLWEPCTDGSVVGLSVLRQWYAVDPFLREPEFVDRSSTEQSSSAAERRGLMNRTTGESTYRLSDESARRVRQWIAVLDAILPAEAGVRFIGGGCLNDVLMAFTHRESGNPPSLDRPANTGAESLPSVLEGLPTVLPPATEFSEFVINPCDESRSGYAGLAARALLLLRAHSLTAATVSPLHSCVLEDWGNVLLVLLGCLSRLCLRELLSTPDLLKAAAFSGSQRCLRILLGCSFVEMLPVSVEHLAEEVERYLGEIGAAPALLRTRIGMCVSDLRSFVGNASIAARWVLEATGKRT